MTQEYQIEIELVGGKYKLTHYKSEGGFPCNYPITPIETKMVDTMVELAERLGRKRLEVKIKSDD